MKRPLTVLGIAILWAGGLASAARSDTLTVVIDNIEASEGTVMLQVMSSEAEFSGEGKPIASFMQRAEAGELSFSTKLPAGEYAVRIMHDVNNNGELDSNFVGMPTEPWAFSNNATGSFGPPGWEQAKFTLAGETVQQIQLNH